MGTETESTTGTTESTAELQPGAAGPAGIRTHCSGRQNTFTSTGGIV